MERKKFESRPPQEPVAIINSAMESAKYQIGKLPRTNEILTACETIARIWAPIRKTDHYSRKASIDATYGSVEMHLTLAPSDSIRSTFEIFEYLEDTLNLKFTTEDQDESRKFHCYGNVTFDVHIYFKYSESCSIVETRKPVTYEAVSKKIICR